MICHADYKAGAVPISQVTAPVLRCRGWIFAAIPSQSRLYPRGQTIQPYFAVEPLVVELRLEDDRHSVNIPARGNRESGEMETAIPVEWEPPFR